MRTRDWTGRVLLLATALIAVRSMPASAQVTPTNTYCGPADIAFVVDNSPSMVSTLNDLKNNAANNPLSRILTQIEQSCDPQNDTGTDYRLALVTFTDTVRVVLNFTPNNRGVFQTAIAGLTTASTGLGIANASDEALNTVINALPARIGQTGGFTQAFRGTVNGNVHVRKFIVLLTDASPGGFDGDYTEPTDPANAHQRALEAAAKGIRILAVLPPTGPNGGNAQGVMQDYANTTGGYFTRTDEPSPPFPLGLTLPSTVILRYFSDPDPLFKGSCTRVNRPPVAKCGSAFEITALPACNAVHASIDNGSYDVEDDVSITRVQSPPGPYLEGQTNVTLTVSDLQGAAASCSTTVDVTCGDDTQNPGVVLDDPSFVGPVTGVVPLLAYVTDETATVVDFLAGATLIGTDPAPFWDLSATYTVDWNTNALLNGSSVTLTARATDAAGRVTTSAPVTVTITHTDAQPPKVTLWGPIPPNTGIKTVSATASDDRGIANVQFYADATLLGTDTAAPFEASWDTTGLNDGSIVLLRAVATDLANKTTESTIGVMVDHSDRTAPVVAITQPTAGAATGVMLIEASATDGGGIARVEFYVNGATLIGSDDTAPYTAFWDTRSLAAGSYSVLARAVDTANNSADATVALTVSNGPPVFITALTSSASFPRQLGGSITWTAAATGGSSALEYQFWRRDFATGTWNVARPYGPGPTYVWTPTSAGAYAFKVWVRSTVAVRAAYEAALGTNVLAITSGSPAVLTALTPSQASPAPALTDVTWMATASGGSGPLEYEFWKYCYASPGWTLEQDYSPSNVFVWTTLPSEVGTCFVQARVRTVGLTSLPYESALDSTAFKVTSPTPINVTSLTASPSSPVTVSTPVRWTAVATGGTGTLHYQFWIYSYATRAWSIARPYGPSAVFDWTPSAAGSYAFQVWAKNASAATFESSMGSGVFTVTTGTPATITSLTPSALPVTVGTQVTWTALAAGGGGTLEYEFWRYCMAAPGWQIVRPYGAGNTYSWTPQAADVGMCYLHVRVRTQGSSVPYEGSRDSGGVMVLGANPITISSFSAPVSSVRQGTPVTWTAVASGGTAPLEYQFWRYSYATGSWTIVGPYATTSTYSWTPGAADVGSYVFQVWVKSAGAATYEAYRSAGTFVVTP